VTSFPILLFISFYERQAKLIGAITFFDTVSHVVDKVFDTLPRSLKRMTFFEGLVGVDGDINAIFEVEEESASALCDDDNDQWQTLTPSRQGRVINGVPFGKSNTVMSAQSYSPLAQVYNPVVVDDNVMKEDLSNPGNLTLPAISYGPATRRRFTSTQRRPQAVEPPDQADSNQLQRFPTIPTTNYKVSPPEHGVLRSRSQDRNSKMQPSTAFQPKTSYISLQSKTSSISNGEHQESEFLQRLDAIEKKPSKDRILTYPYFAKYTRLSSNRS